MEKKIHVYVAGPFRAKTPWLIEQNVRRAEEAALEVWKMGAVAVVPHMLTRQFQDMLPDQVWLEGLLSLMSTCDVMLVLPGWKNSEGTKAEITEAQKQTKHIFYTLKELSDWLADNAAAAPVDHVCASSCDSGCDGDRRQDPPKSTTMTTRRADDICPDCGCVNGYHRNDCEKI
jgi:nucleoside 2-deoxyribosyltransferase